MARHMMHYLMETAIKAWQLECVGHTCYQALCMLWLNSAQHNGGDEQCLIITKKKHYHVHSRH